MVRKPKAVLVTGGCGFIGSAFIRWGIRHRQARIVNLDALTYAGNPSNLASVADSDRYTFVHGDILDGPLVADLCDEHAVDTIMHCAAESHVDRSLLGPLAFVRTNVLGTATLLEVVRARPHVHFHHVSTDEVFGSLGAEGRFHESSPYDPRSPYAASKAGSDHLVRAWAHTWGIKATLSNCSNNYGPYQFPEKLIPLMILNLVTGKPLPVYGDGSNVRDWIHVTDHAEALWRILEGGVFGRTYNVGGNAERTNLQIIEALIAEVAARTGESVARLQSLVTFVRDRPGHDHRYAIDGSRVEAELGWSPRYTLGEGLRETVAWYLDHPDWVNEVATGAYRDWLQVNYRGR